MTSNFSTATFHSTTSASSLEILAVGPVLGQFEALRDFLRQKREEKLYDLCLCIGPFFDDGTTPQPKNDGLCRLEPYLKFQAKALLHQELVDSCIELGSGQRSMQTGLSSLTGATKIKKEPSLGDAAEPEKLDFAIPVVFFEWGRLPKGIDLEKRIKEFNSSHDHSTVAGQQYPERRRRRRDFLTSEGLVRLNHYLYTCNVKKEGRDNLQIFVGDKGPLKIMYILKSDGIRSKRNSKASTHTEDLLLVSSKWGSVDCLAGEQRLLLPARSGDKHSFEDANIAKLVKNIRPRLHLTTSTYEMQCKKFICFDSTTFVSLGSILKCKDNNSGSDNEVRFFHSMSWPLIVDRSSTSATLPEHPYALRNAGHEQNGSRLTLSFQQEDAGKQGQTQTETSSFLSNRGAGGMENKMRRPKRQKQGHVDVNTSVQDGSVAIMPHRAVAVEKPSQNKSLEHSSPIRCSDSNHNNGPYNPSNKTMDNNDTISVTRITQSTNRERQDTQQEAHPHSNDGSNMKGTNTSSSTLSRERERQTISIRKGSWLNAESTNDNGPNVFLGTSSKHNRERGSIGTFSLSYADRNIKGPNISYNISSRRRDGHRSLVGKHPRSDADIRNNAEPIRTLPGSEDDSANDVPNKSLGPLSMKRNTHDNQRESLLPAFNKDGNQNNNKISPDAREQQSGISGKSSGADADNRMCEPNSSYDILSKKLNYFKRRRDTEESKAPGGHILEINVGETGIFSENSSNEVGIALDNSSQRDIYEVETVKSPCSPSSPNSFTSLQPPQSNGDDSPSSPPSSPPSHNSFTSLHLLQGNGDDSSNESVSEKFLEPLRAPIVESDKYEEPKLPNMLEQNDVYYDDIIKFVRRGHVVNPKALHRANHSPIPEVQFPVACTMLPLHHAILNRTRDTPVILIQTILSCYRDAARIQCEKFDDNDTVIGKFALDYACNPSHKDANEMKRVSIAENSKEDVLIRILVKEWPLALKYVTSEGEDKATWLHRILEHRPNLKLVKYLVEEFNKLEDTCRERQDCIQSHICEVEDGQGNLPLHIAVEYYADEAVVKYLIRQYPGAIKHKRNLDGNLPLHCAALFKCFPGTLVQLLEQYPQAVQKANLQGKTPLHLLFVVDNKHDEFSYIGRYLWNRDYSEDTVGTSNTEVLSSDPNARSIHPRAGTLPREHMLRSMIEEYCRYLEQQRETSFSDAADRIAGLLICKEDEDSKSIYARAERCRRRIHRYGPREAERAIDEALKDLKYIVEKRDIVWYQSSN